MVLNKKSIILFLFLFKVLFIIAQVKPPKVYGGIGFYLAPDLEGSGYADFTAGIEVFSYKFIAPEIEVSYFIGGIETLTETDENGYDSKIFDKAFNATIVSITPKLFFWEGEGLRLVVIPKYSFADITVRAKVTGITDFYAKTEAFYESKRQLNFWSFGAGIEGELNNEKIHIGGYLIYTGFDVSKGIKEFELGGFNVSRFATKTLGINIRVMYSFW
ncbi:MAG: hypothetical protein COA50_09320 [Flavobacteriaceae bacterium]|nr:MAG: hypothetical protein COA50_09320 [Flavobacteriaceae bacterium]